MHLYDLFFDFIATPSSIITIKASGSFKERQNIP